MRIIERAELDASAFTAAGVQSARSLALLRQDDLGNFHAALRAQEINPDLRLVVAIFNTSLGERIRTFFRDCAVLSGSSMSAPSFVAAALGEPAPSHIRVAGRTLYVARRTDVTPAQRGLRAGDDPGPAVAAACSRRTPPAPTWCSRSPTARRATRSPGSAGTRCAPPPAWPGTCSGTSSASPSPCLFAVLVIGFVLLVTSGGFSLANAAYLTGLDAGGRRGQRPGAVRAGEVAQMLLTFDGLAFLPVLTAVVVGARLTGSLRRQERPLNDHVIVVGLGNVGTRIVGQLHDLGVSVACVDKSENAAGVAMARRLGLRVVIGETHREDIAARGGDRHLPGPGLGDQQRQRQPGDRAARARAGQ